ncbi:MAG TPA: ABC transporter permease [Solirubrobacteraceae bacterium]|nr:ABC transporter permease [Solirubrobacteraceae bacterium]
MTTEAPAPVNETPAPVDATQPAGAVAAAGRVFQGFADYVTSASGLKRLAVTLGAYLISLAVFGAIVATQHANPFSVYKDIVQSAFFESGSITQILLRSVPIVLAALAVSIPARAGLVNVGGEGQLIVGAIAATGVALYILPGAPQPLELVAMAVAGFAAGAVWGAIPGALRVGLNANESVSTLLMNFIANDILLYLLYQPWKDPAGTGQPESKPLQAAATLPSMLSGLNLGVLITLVVAIAIYFILRYTGWGFALRVVGGNQEAARRAGLPVKRLMISSIAVGGGLAGLGGMLYLSGTQLQLLPGGTATFGYTAFLAAFLGRQGTIRVVLSALLFSAIAISAPGLQLSYGLDGNAVDILLALAVAAPLALTAGRRKAI